MVKIVEFTNRDTENQLPFNVAEDVHVYMKNDPMFYRKHYFPCMAKMAEMHRAGKAFNMAQTIKPVIKRAAEGYCKRYNMPMPAATLFREEDENELVERICSEEMDRIKQGEY